MSVSITLTHYTVPARPEPERRADEKMEQYADYINELYLRHPKTFGKLKNFIDRGNCVCSTKYNCLCTTTGMVCTCRKDADGHICQCGKGSSMTERCETRRVEHQVRIYDIDRTRASSPDFYDFLLPTQGGREGQDYYNAGNPDEINKLKKKLWEDYDDGDGQPRHETSSGDQDVRLCRLITVNHLSANVAKLLGSRYDIPGDFFNRHLPGTEAISGRLISRLTSALQVDFDELYESSEPFSNLWEGWHRLDGHDIIGESLRQNFLFHEHVGWDYFPTAAKDWKESQENTPMSSGTEAELKNVFQFDLTHRVSIYSKPPHHSSTAIIIFYPTLPVCRARHHYHIDNQGKKRHDCPHGEECDLVEFRAVPDTIPQMSTVTKPDHDRNPQRSHQRRLPKDRGLEEVDAKGRRVARIKWDYARAFDREFQIQVQEFWERIRRQLTENPTRGVEDPDFSFVDLFGVPLFRIIASNWARLAERRTLDLRLLEWRPTRATNIDTVQGIKTRRIAIARHQKCINTCLAVLRNLRQEERVRRYKKELRGYKEHHNHRTISPDSSSIGEDQPSQHGNLDLMPAIDIEVIKSSYITSDDNEYNKGLSNGLVGTEKDDEFSWDRVYYEFFELKASMDALANRADKIQEGMIGLLSIQISQNSSMLSFIGALFTILVIPISVVSCMFSLDSQPGFVEKSWGMVWGMFWGTAGVVALLNLLLYYGQRAIEVRESFPQKIKRIKGYVVVLRELAADWIIGLETGEPRPRRVHSHPDATTDESDESV